ncbi:MAG: transcription initiation factor IIB [Nitrosarchaeum sp.]|nr:transcription initiation factor IIB [Nitrosarchaeum sp.]
MLRCGRCGKESIIHDRSLGEIFCKSCGFVIVEKINDLNHDSINFDNDKDNRRTGAKMSMSVHDFGLSTMIGGINKDAKGNTISASTNATLKRIRILDQRSQLHKHSDINYRIAFDILQRIQDKIGVSNHVKELAAYIYRKAVERKITQGRSINAVIAASMYAACRNTQTLRTLRDISEVTDIKPKKIAQSYRAIVKQLDLKIPVVNQVNCLSKISNNLGASEKTKYLAMEILQKAADLGILAGRDPVGISAAALYYACLIKKESFTQTQVAEASRVTVVTVRNRFHEIKKIIPFSLN